MNNSELILTNIWMRVLACVAITPGLRSILFFDTHIEILKLASETLSQMLEVVAEKSVKKVTLTTIETEEDLWGSFQISRDGETLPFQPKPGLLTDNSTLHLVIIPDLTKLSLAACRACVVLIGADVAYLERHGQSLTWKSNLCWLAGCKSSEVGMVSPHLLDRFALRLKGEFPHYQKARNKDIIKWLNSPDSNNLDYQPEKLSIEIQQVITQALQQYPILLETSAKRILEYTVNEIYPRREIALTRFSQALAKLEGVSEIEITHVDTAAKIIGLQPPISTTEIPENSPFADSNIKPEFQPRKPPSIKSKSNFKPPTDKAEIPVHESDTKQYLTSTPLIVKGAAYPEDNAPVEREAASLRLPTRRFAAKTATRGIIIGVEKAKNLQDIAIVRTVLEATKFQPIRRKNNLNGREGLILSGSDFYCYRRSPVAEQMLMLILDHTCLQNCNWQESLLPYLSWAYVERASVCLIQVGAANATHELRAEKIMAQNILVPRISAGIEAGKGKATPLAHGLHLALQTLRHALQHGRSTVQQATLVLITDGRGNVPLEASHYDKITTPVGKKGVEDALLVAENIKQLDRVNTVLLNPQPQQYPELPLQLAQTLGAKVILIPSKETWELAAW
ncbi:MAG TPA: hypothetical protein VK184_07610 [Nostocaceae cyanobacterium]|nr:hypothetical protein [Nostocaceae cyanobacterium]